MIFQDRHDAGRELARELVKYKKEDPVILALPRGGVPVAYEVSRALNVPMEVVVARKLGSPQRPEYGLGAVAEGGITVVDRAKRVMSGVSEEEMRGIAQREKEELERRVSKYRQGRALPKLDGRTVIIVDDGLATGVTARAATLAIQRYNPGRVIFAAPVCAPETCAKLSSEIEVVCAHTPDDFEAVGAWYGEFSQVSDEEVIELLARVRSRHKDQLGSPEFVSA